MEKTGAIITKSERANRCCSNSNRKEQKMSNFNATVTGILVEILEPEFPEAVTYLKSEKGRHVQGVHMQCREVFNTSDDDAYHGAVHALWEAENDFQEAGDFLNSRNVRCIFNKRVGEKVRREIRRADLEAERAERDEAERRTRLKDKLDWLTRDGILSNEEREALDLAPFFGRLEDELPW